MSAAIKVLEIRRLNTDSALKAFVSVRTGCITIHKHPLGLAMPHGSTDATLDGATISRWWSRWPQANIAIATLLRVCRTDPGRPKPEPDCRPS